MSKYLWEKQGTKLTDYDLPRVGHRIGVGEDEVHAILDVETRGTGFDRHGVIRLFESHIFYRQLPAGKRAQAIQMGLAHRKWKEAKKAGNYKNNYERFLKAYAFDSKAALESCSWGLGQIMGFNHGLAGYESAMAMVVDFTVSEANQLEAMIEFIISASLDDELRAHNWAGFARGYNGSGYAAHNYHGRLRNSFAKWQKIKDTPWTPEMAEQEDKEAEEIEPEIERQSTIPPLAAGGAGLTVVAVSGLPLWAQYVLGIVVVLLVIYVVTEKFSDEP